MLTKLKVLRAAQAVLCDVQALFALQPDRDLLGRLDLLLEDGLGLTTETSLLSVVSALALGEERGLPRLVLGHRVLPVDLAVPAIRLLLLGEEHL